MTEQEFMSGLVRININKEEIRQKVLKQAKRRSRIPAIAAACLAGIVLFCAAVPPVRAAIARWFSDVFSVSTYLSQPEENRVEVPELDAIMEEAKPKPSESAALQTASVKVNVTDPEWQEWADSLDPTIGDVYFDGRQLMVPIDLGGGAYGLIGKDFDPARFPSILAHDIIAWYTTINGQKYDLGMILMFPHSKVYYDQFMEPGAIGDIFNEERVLTDEQEAKLRAWPSCKFVAIAEFHDYEKDMTEEEKASSWQDSMEGWEYRAPKISTVDPGFSPSEFQHLDRSQPLAGIQQMEVVFPLHIREYGEPVQVEGGEEQEIYETYIGTITVNFAFDPPAGYELTNEYDLSAERQLTGDATFYWADWESDPDYVPMGNITKDLSGVKLRATHMVVMPTETELYLELEVPGDWTALEKGCFASAFTQDVAGDGAILLERASLDGYYESDDENVYTYCAKLPILPSELSATKTLTVTPVLARYTGFDDDPFVEGEITRRLKDNVQGWQEDFSELPACALTVEVPDIKLPE